MPYALIVDHIRNHQSSWSCGRFGAIAEFHRGPDEAVEIFTGPTVGAVTERGAIRIERFAELRPVAYETVGKDVESWGQGVALCLPRSVAQMNARTVVTELGPDENAVRPRDRAMTLFDLGLGGTQAETCVRTADPEAIALLRSAIHPGAAGYPAAAAEPESPSRLLLPARPDRGLPGHSRAGRQDSGGAAHPCAASPAGQ
jgi:hypothetical protein